MSWQVLNFAPKLYRSSQPECSDLERMKEKGLRLVINLRDEAEDSRHYCRHLGLLYAHIPVKDWDVPTLEQVDEFIRVVSDREQLPALVHCLAGVGRTGLFVSCYRIARGMDSEQAIQTSDAETPAIRMNLKQRTWIEDFARQAAR